MMAEARLIQGSAMNVGMSGLHVHIMLLTLKRDAQSRHCLLHATNAPSWALCSSEVCCSAERSHLSSLGCPQAAQSWRYAVLGGLSPHPLLAHIQE